MVIVWYVTIDVDRQMALYSGDKGQCSRLSTSGVDGQLVIWDLKVTFLTAVLFQFIISFLF